MIEKTIIHISYASLSITGPGLLSACQTLCGIDIINTSSVIPKDMSKNKKYIKKCKKCEAIYNKLN
jgi:hypothetical protein